MKVPVNYPILRSRLIFDHDLRYRELFITEAQKPFAGGPRVLHWTLFGLFREPVMQFLHAFSTLFALFLDLGLR